MTVVGKTEDNKQVVAGIFFLYDSHGLPFAEIFDLCQELNFQPCWLSLITEAKHHGWKNATILSRLKEAIQDSYGNPYWKKVEEKINQYELL